ncbi:MAG TPA: methyltransferase domain-containing protein [Dehalococcoidia bacterium]|jgi:demethylmenaquinone methyltransferase/2-methoxy-6-polyprenyl-1,4-benzoquinol methylase|nr:methyltransferase domain-containing protein [Dehalococcoidia bacterium]
MTEDQRQVLRVPATLKDIKWSYGKISKLYAIYMASTLELFDTPDIPRVLQEIKRVLKPRGRLVVASMSREGHENSKFLRFYEWLHQRFPRYASCRPIYVE